MGKNSREFLRNFTKLSLKTVIPQKSLILGTNSEEFLENFWGISYRKWFSRNSSEILQRKSPGLENLGKFLTFVTWVMFMFMHDNHEWVVKHQQFWKNSNLLPFGHFIVYKIKIDDKIIFFYLFNLSLNGLNGLNGLHVQYIKLNVHFMFLD